MNTLALFLALATANMPGSIAVDEAASTKGGATRLVHPATSVTATVAANGTAARLTFGQAIASGVLSGGGFELTAGTRLRRGTVEELLFESGFESTARTSPAAD